MHVTFPSGGFPNHGVTAVSAERRGLRVACDSATFERRSGQWLRPAQGGSKCARVVPELGSTRKVMMRFVPSVPLSGCTMNLNCEGTATSSRDGAAEDETRRPEHACTPWHQPLSLQLPLAHAAPRACGTERREGRRDAPCPCTATTSGRRRGRRPRSVRAREGGAGAETQSRRARVSHYCIHAVREGRFARPPAQAGAERGGRVRDRTAGGSRSAFGGEAPGSAWELASNARARVRTSSRNESPMVGAGSGALIGARARRGSVVTGTLRVEVGRRVCVSVRLCETCARRVWLLRSHRFGFVFQEEEGRQGA